MHWTGGTATLPRTTVDPRHQIALALALVAALAIPAVTPLALPKLFPTASGADNTCYKFTAAERGFASKMNQERKARGLGTMKLDPELGKVSARHTKEMTSINTLVHSTTTQLTRRVTNWTSLGENVGVGATVDSLHTAFMNSPAHRDNILHGPFNNVGVGVKKDGGRMWVTVIFETRGNPGTRLAMPSC
ncbi:MAG: CAP domain-containing protein [Actinomycetota bacterium]|nr:CAP domain-containing protein [Actinomycetota bacterium]